MIVNLIKAILAVTTSAGLITWFFVWFARASTSDDSTVRRRLRFVEVLMSLGIVALSALSAEKANDPKIAVTIIGLIIIAWLFRGAQLLLSTGKAQ
jgi:hypothetical protein